MRIAKVFRFNEQSITTIKENEEQLLTAPVLGIARRADRSGKFQRMRRKKCNRRQLDKTAQCSTSIL